MADPFFADVSLLLLCNGADASTTFTDSGPDKRTVSRFGNAEIDTAQSKFGGASGLFDGSGDYLTLAHEPGLDFETGDFTIEFWARLSGIISTRTIINKALTSGSSQYRIYFDQPTAKFGAYTRNSGNTANLFCVAPSTSAANTWYHIAFVRNGDEFTFYLDGVPGTTQTRAGAMYATTETVSIGANNNGTTAFNGWLDDVRFTKGVARYTAAFTPPTAELETGTAPIEKNFAYVGLLLNCDGADGSTTFTDLASTPNTVTAVGDAQIDTAQQKFGTASGLFDGTGDYLTVPNSTLLNLATGNWTIEFWVRLNSTASNIIIAQQATGTGSYPWQFWFEASSSKFGFRGLNSGASASYAMQQTGTSTTGVWYHLAGVRDGNTYRFFVNGVANGSAFLSGSLFATTATLSFGATNTATSPLNGWLDDIRLTKGVARYTDTFTPPTSAFPPANDNRGFLVAEAILGSPAIFGGVETKAYILVPTILGGAAGARLYGGLTAGWVTTDSILGGAFGAKVFGSLVFGKITTNTILGGSAGAMVLGLHDFSTSVVNRPTQYVMDLLLDEALDIRLRVPISSWQGTQQTDNLSYLACVVPACRPWIADINAASHFIVHRRVTLEDGSVLEAEMARAPLDTVQTDEGPQNITASLSGYSPAFDANANPDAARDRTLTGIRSISVYSTGVRLRCAIDWLLRPAQRAFYAETSFIVSYINYYVSANLASVDEYMDVGERIEP